MQKCSHARCISRHILLCLGPHHLTIKSVALAELYTKGLSSSLCLVYAQPFKAPTHHTNHKIIHKSYFKHFQMSFFFLQIFHRISSTFLLSIGLNSNLHCLSEAQSTKYIYVHTCLSQHVKLSEI